MKAPKKPTVSKWLTYLLAAIAVALMLIAIAKGFVDMAGHRNVVTSFTVDDQIEGVTVGDTIVNAIWPNATSSEIAAKMRGVLELGLLVQLMSTGMNVEAASAMVAGNTPDSV